MAAVCVAAFATPTSLRARSVQTICTGCVPVGSPTSCRFDCLPPCTRPLEGIDWGGRCGPRQLSATTAQPTHTTPYRQLRGARRRYPLPRVVHLDHCVERSDAALEVRKGL